LTTKCPNSRLLGYAKKLLLGYAKKLDRENAELKLMLAALQGDVDRSIRYLDPDR